MSERTLVTGFGPFLGISDNASSKLARTLGRPYQELEMAYDSVEDFIFHLDPSSFDRMLLMGVAPGRAHLSAELFARNTYGIAADAKGVVRSGSIQEGQPLILGTTLFGGAQLSEILITHPQMRMSLNAGTYLCNFVYFKALSAFPLKQVGFLHVPTLATIKFEEQLETVTELLEALEAPVGNGASPAGTGTLV